jgi:hypothetical protein
VALPDVYIESAAALSLYGGVADLQIRGQVLVQEKRLGKRKRATDGTGYSVPPVACTSQLFESPREHKPSVVIIKPELRFLSNVAPQNSVQLNESR